jgi:hypothetical protein
MSNFPNSFDDDTTLPAVNDNITEIGGDAINALRDFAFNTELYLGLGANGSTTSIATRLGVSLNPDGTINPSALTSLGLVTLPITQDQIATNAGIPESKLMLNHRTNDLFNYIRDLAGDVNTALGWIATTGVELQPHLLGAIYRHSMDQIDVSHDPTNFPFMDNKFRVLRNNNNSYTLVNDINNELLAHQWADGSPFGVIQNVVTNDGSVYPSNYGHTASGIFLNTSRFETIPQNDEDVQSAFEFIDQSSILLLGTRIQNLYANGISVNSRSSSLLIDGYGQNVVPITAAIAFLLSPNGSGSTPVDNIENGDDIIQFLPSLPDGYLFDEQFALVRPGNIVRINYGTIEVAFVVKEKKYIPGINGNSSRYYIRIAGKNLFYSPNATARIDKALFNNNKYGVLSVAAANNPLTGVPSSLIVGSPRGAQALGIGFNPDQFDHSHYLLYLAFFPTGNPSDGYTILPAIDVTGNLGLTPGSYTLDSIVASTNNAFRQAGFNYRFIAFSYQGNFGIMLADSYNNASFSIISFTVTPNGFVDTANTAVEFPNNVISPPPANLPDPLGFGVAGANIASPPYMNSYGSAAASQLPTKLFVPLRRNNYYVNGVEEDRLNLEVGQALDNFGDGYWNATIQTITPGSGHVEVTYNIPLNLSTSDLKVGKTLVVQSAGSGQLVNFGRFIITSVNFQICPTVFTQITVFDAVHATGVSPSAILPVGSPVFIYFNSDSVAFNAENSSDFNTYVPGTASFKRHFEIYVNDAANTYTNERGRINTNGSNVSINGITLYGSSPLSFVNLISISPKLTGFSSSGLNKINLQIFSYDQTTGLFDGYLCSWDGVNATSAGPLTTGQKGLITRFYDNTNIDYVDILFSTSDNVPQITSPKNIDIQLFPTLSLDEEIMLLGTCQFNDTTSQVNYLQDRREFGNISEEQFTTSAINFIEAPTRELQENGIIRGFDIISQNTTNVSFDGGMAVVNGKLVQVDVQTVDIPIVLEALPVVVGGLPTINSSVNIITWFVCVNNKSEIELIASTDYDPLGTFAAQYAAVGLTHQRLFNVYNPNALSPSPYTVRGTYFTNLIITQIDVTPIATITTTVINSSGNYIVSNVVATDARRYVSSGYGGLSEPLTFGPFASFRTFEALNNWLILLNNNFSASTFQSNVISNKVIVKGHVTISSTFSINYVFNEVIFDGEGSGYFDVFVATGFELGSNVHFRNLLFNYHHDPVVFSDVGYVTTDLINTGKGLLHLGVTLGDSNVSVKDCIFTWFPSVSGVAGAPSSSTAINRYSFINIELSAPATNAPPVILQNVNISGNTFSDSVLSSFILANLETVRAAISFVSLSAVVNAPGGGLKLIDVLIDGNVCNKDQMIAIVPLNTSLTGNIINAALNTTNCTISKNICGAISVFTQYDDPIDFNFTTDYFNFVADKNNSLTIENNTCKYITATDASGTDIAQLSPTININSGTLNVFNNTCSWIKLVPNLQFAVSFYNIKNNNLVAYDTNFKKNYLNGSTSSLTNAAIELVIIGSSISALITIDGNTINAGAYDAITSIPVFTYDFGIWTAHDANICNNNILNLLAVLGSPGSAVGVNLSTSPGINFHSDISHNTFYRFSNVWQAYVSLGFAGKHSVVNNFFDQITPDGNIAHTENQVIGSVNLSNIHDNSNQIVNVPISLVDGQSYFSAIGGAAVSATGPATGSSILYTGIGADGYSPTDASNVLIFKYGQSPASGASSQYVGIAELALASATAVNYRNATFTIPLSNYLPAGAKILQVQIGMWLQYQGAAILDVTTHPTNNALTLSLFKSTDSLSTVSSTAITDVRNNIAPAFPNPFFGTDFSNPGGTPLTYTVLVYQSSSSGSNYSVVTPATAQGATQFLTIGPSSSPALLPGNYTVGNSYRINAQIDLNFIRTSAGTVPTDQIIFYLSPLVVTYTW